MVRPPAAPREPPEFRWNPGPEAFETHERLGGAFIADDAVRRAPDVHIPLPLDIGPDPGMFRTDIVYNPANKTAAQGFVHIPVVRGEHLKKFDRYILGLKGLAVSFNRFTNITAVLDMPLPPEDREAEQRGVSIGNLTNFHPPIVYILTDRNHPITDVEWEDLCKYTEKDSTILIIESGEPGNPRLRHHLRAALSQTMKCAIEPIPKDHPLFHCFFDFDNGPPPGAGPELGAVPHNVQTHLDGIWTGGRLVAVFSDLGYGLCWGAPGNHIEQMKMGVNLVVYGIVQQKERHGHRRIALE